MRLIHGNAVDMPLADASVDCIVTSPPYYGVRVYEGCPATAWGDGWRGCLGLEPTVDQFIEHLMQVMAECWDSR